MAILRLEMTLVPRIVKRHPGKIRAETVIGKIPPLHFAELQERLQSGRCLNPRHFRVCFLPERQAGG